MDIIADPALAGTENVIKDKINRSLEFRDSINLGVPETDNLAVHISSSALGNESGSVSLNLEEPIMNINALNLASSMDFFHIAYKGVYSDYLRFLNMTREIADSDAEVNSMLDAPANFFEKNMDRYADSSRAVWTLNHRESIRNLAKNTGLFLEMSKNDVIYLLKEFSQRTINHEIDHLDYGNSTLYNGSQIARENLAHIESEIMNGNTDLIKDYPELCAEALYQTMINNPILETRGLFFSHIDMNLWKDADFENAKYKVVDNYLGAYLNNAGKSYSKVDLPSKLQKYLFGMTFSEKADSDEFMKTISSKYPIKEISYTTSEQREALGIDMNDVSIAHSRLNDVVTGMEENAEQAALAAGIAYRDNPSRHQIANLTEDFESYVNVCKGQL